MEKEGEKVDEEGQEGVEKRLCGYCKQLRCWRQRSEIEMKIVKSGRGGRR